MCWSLFSVKWAFRLDLATRRVDRKVGRRGEQSEFVHGSRVDGPQPPDRDVGRQVLGHSQVESLFRELGAFLRLLLDAQFGSETGKKTTALHFDYQLQLFESGMNEKKRTDRNPWTKFLDRRSLLQENTPVLLVDSNHRAVQLVRQRALPIDVRFEAPDGHLLRRLEAK